MLPSSQQAYQSLQDYNSKRRKTEDIQKEAETKYDLPGITGRLSNLRSLVGNLESSVENVDPSVRSRTSGGFSTEGQNQALIARESKPILGNLAKQQSALGETQQQFSLSSALASQLAQSIRSDDETGYQRLLDQYNAAVAQEQAAETKRQFDEQLKASREAAERAAKAASSGYDIGSILSSLGIGSGGGSSASSAASVDPTQQKAYNDVKNLLSKDSARIQREYSAIKKSAGYGNAYDKIKLALIEQLYPAVRNYGSNTVSLSRAIPTTVPLNSSIRNYGSNTVSLSRAIPTTVPLNSSSGGGLSVDVAHPRVVLR
jgi:hypothetical protein